MIAFSNTSTMALRRRGRPAGARNELACAPKGLAVSGSSTSAAKMNCRSGTAGRNPAAWVWIPGEGWVRWLDLAAQVAEAFRLWRIKKSLEGVRIHDGWERRQAEIEEAVMYKTTAKGSVIKARRLQFLQEWRVKNFQLMESAGLVVEQFKGTSDSWCIECAVDPSEARRAAA